MCPIEEMRFSRDQAPPAEDWRVLLARYRPRVRAALTESIVPFWWRAIDAERGGVFNCWNNEGTRLIHRGKFTWSQGRFAWLWSRLGEATARGLLPGDAGAFLAHARKTVEFLRAHAFLDDGRCAFLLGEDGSVQEARPGLGVAPSIYADCFVAMGLAEFARVAGDRETLEVAWRLFESIDSRINAGGFPTHPDPIPDGHASHAIAMIAMNLALVIAQACEELKDSREKVARSRCIAAAAEIFEMFLLPGGRLTELRCRGDARDDTLLVRHLNPGHALESLWMLLTIAAREGRDDWIARASEGVLHAFEKGWDSERGGLLHFVDFEGGEPRGTAGASDYEHSIRASWNAKLWWVHSEAIYTSLLCYKLTGSAAARGWFERAFEYALRVFPHPDRDVGEWIQIRDRDGMPIEQVVALPVKDPYHVARNLMQVLELFSSCEMPPGS